MFTKNLPKIEKEKSQILANIPEKARRDIEERGFYLYEWISSDEVKMSIQRDYLEILSKVGVWIAGIAMFGAVLGGGLTPLGFGIFFGILGISYTVTLLYLSIIALRRSLSLSNTAKVVMTDKALSLGGEIIPYQDIDKYKEKIEKWGQEFSEPLFGESELSSKKSSLLRNTLGNIGAGAKKFFDFSDNFRGNSKEAGQLILFVLVLGVLYLLSTGAIYLFGLFFIWLLSLGVTLLNKFILRVTGHEVQLINDTFESIDIHSQSLQKSSSSLSSLLGEARDNNWQENLSGKISSGIDTINSDASFAVEESKQLKKLLENSKYKEIFNFTTFGSWLKKKIIDPLKDILELIEKNRSLIASSLIALEKQIQTTSDPSLKGPLELQKRRFDIQKEMFEKQILMIQGYLDKLK